MKNIDIIKSYVAGERPYVKVGYTGDINKYIIRKEGETWTDGGGKNWIQKKSGPQTVTRVMDIIREETNVKCTECKCEIRWGSRLDRKMHNKTEKCFDCLVKEETSMRIRGVYKQYERKKVLKNELSYYTELKKYISESKEYLKEHKVFTYVNSNGLVEEWDNEAASDVSRNLKKDFTRCLKEIKRTETELKQIEDELAKSATTV